MDLYNILDRMFRARREAFLRKMDTSVERNQQTAVRKDYKDTQDGVVSGAEGVPRGIVSPSRNDYSYDFIKFLAAKTKSRNESHSFGIAKVNYTKVDDHGTVSALFVYWH